MVFDTCLSFIFHFLKIDQLDFLCQDFSGHSYSLGAKSLKNRQASVLIPNLEKTKMTNSLAFLVFELMIP